MLLVLTGFPVAVGRVMRVTHFGPLTGVTSVVLGLLVPPVAAQNGTLIGTVTSADGGGPLQGVQIRVLGGAQPIGVLTDTQGQYSAQVRAGGYTVVVESLGFLDARFDRVSVSVGEITTLDIVLTPQALSLDPVTITVSRLQLGEKSTQAPATSYRVDSLQITERATPNIADHLREAPGVDIVTSGLQSARVVVRGFNDAFSGDLHMLSDHRLAGVPSLRVNLMNFIPITDQDIERIEVVLGPGSALYGPNTANGVVQIISKSPLTTQGTSVTFGAGERSVLQGSMRSALLLTDDLGVKISAQYVRGDEWQYMDPTEQANRDAADADPAACLADKAVRRLSPAEAQTACARIGARDFQLERWGLEARADYRFADDGVIVGTYGRNSSSGIELSSLSAAQNDDWIYQFYQARVSKGRLFAQVYYNTSDAGNTFLLRDGATLIDESRLIVTQIQDGIAIADDRQEFTLGFDYFGTRPNSRGSIYGSYEGENDIDEFGWYLQSATALSDKVDFVAAARLDAHSALADNVWSPRAALVLKPQEGQSVRFAYNRAFSTPTVLNHFVDISGGFAPYPLGALGFSARAYGTGSAGWSLQNPDGSLRGMRSPFNPGGAGELLSADTHVLWQLACGFLEQQGVIDPTASAVLCGLTPTNDDIARLLLDPNTQTVTPVEGAMLPDVPPLRESHTETFEVGWTGVFKDRISISADVFYMNKRDFVSPLIVQTPLLLLDRDDLEAYLTPYVGPANAAALADGIGGGPDTPPIPLAVASSDQVPSQGADLILTFRNLGDVDLWGADLAFDALLTEDWRLSGSFSLLGKDYFPIADGSTLALNAPREKGSLSIAYRNVLRGFSASARVRASSGFPVQSGVFVGTRCIGADMNAEDCVDDYAMVDLTASFRVPNTAATLQMSVNNAFNTPYRSFVGVPEIGRFAMVRVRYDLF